mmetsp:Transcript_30119/g.42345  ORF Transcript_30119/g.42345 Transcript_30119/m.42345 type:complete len:86 (-) Transcript_30119:97-354(-)|eukprot:CAMPEP_0168555158 /NCGR_PEP_ID=MMETSP0413-20121227/8175_1 /TAXON_ID=136452 /ORGANISM="Filamoeba nolandi, Strain NC-AS-23-1" /LENGTH=85 /DNA_ID=CAMNT_0008585969 /DNA_START=160 /DNA_END=420 /DNA_ORIENTATION=+
MEADDTHKVLEDIISVSREFFFCKEHWEEDKDRYAVQAMQHQERLFKLILELGHTHAELGEELYKILLAAPSDWEEKMRNAAKKM